MNWLTNRFRNRFVSEDSAVATTSKIALSASLSRSILGPNVVVGEYVKIQDAFILENTHIEDNAVISLSVVGPDCVVKKGAKVTAGSVLGKGVIIDEESLIENCLVQSTKSDHGKLLLT